MDKPLPFDVRAGMTSASNALADRLCPGRHYAQRGVPGPAESKDAASGSLVHKAFCGVDVELDRSQRKTLNRGRYLEFEMVRRFFNEPLADEEILKMGHREQRLWSHRGPVPIHSGQLDAFWISRDWKRALIEDLKALFGDIQDATENEQLRDEAAIFWENYPEVEEISVFINQPNVRWKVEDQLLVTYKIDDLRRAHAYMTERVHQSNRIDAPRIPGLDQCKFCRAAGTARCPESQKALTAGLTAVYDEAAATPVQRGEWISNLKVWEKLVKKELEAAKDRLKGNKAWAAGWELSEGKILREITDLVQVEARLIEYFGDKWDGASFLKETCKISVPKLEEWFCEHNDGDNDREKMQTFKLLFESLIATKTTEGSLTKSKAK